MNIKETRQLSGLNVRQFTKKYKIPYTTFHDWEVGNTKPPEYLVNLLERVVIEDLQEKKKGTFMSIYDWACVPLIRRYIKLHLDDWWDSDCTEIEYVDRNFDDFLNWSAALGYKVDRTKA